MNQVNLKRWRPHLRAAKVAGVTVAQYARKHGLSRHTLYAAQRAERDRRGLLAQEPRGARTAAKAAFVPVVVSGGHTPVTVRFPTGVVLECHDVERSQLAALVASLAALPCSV
jgi:hypothetical protein